jgi:hypothetical protein
MKTTVEQLLELLKKIKAPRGKPSKVTRDDYIQQVKETIRKQPKSKGKDK